MFCYMCGPHARSRVPPPSSSWYFTRYFLVAFLIPLQLRPGILKGISDNKISHSLANIVQHDINIIIYSSLVLTCFRPLYAQIDSSIPNKILMPVWCSPEYPWVQPLPRRRHPQELGSLATSVSGWTETVASCIMGTPSLRSLHCPTPRPNTGWCVNCTRGGQLPILYGQFKQRAEVTSAVEFTYYIYIPYFLLYLQSTYMVYVFIRYPVHFPPVYIDDNLWWFLVSLMNSVLISSSKLLQIVHIHAGIQLSLTGLIFTSFRH